ncbi:MAG: 3-ketoacyl-ACP reductase [Isosphaeraceae bacterium]|nr:3-ketoacyl-ACP reductase [Isosphaeraceae bacterium]
MAEDKRVAVVTGGGRGIGRGIVGELARSGLAVAVTYHRDAGAAALACREAEALGAARTAAFQADVSRPDEGRELVRQIRCAFGRIDVWVNNAGVAPEARLDLLETTRESWDRVLDTNLRGPFFLTQMVANTMIGAIEKGEIAEPLIVFITSVSAAFASVARGEYCVSKAGLSMVSRLFAARLAEHGVRVFEVRPGIIATDMTEPVKEQYGRRIADGLTPIRRWGTPADVGRAVAALASGALPFSTGEVIYVDGGLHIPRL